MKNLWIAIITIALSACVNSGSTPEGPESGVTNDGFEGIGDANGALQDTTLHKTWNPSIDTAKGEHRWDLQQRDKEVEVLPSKKH